ncbi:MAG: SDR family NAD(P)-dependent oxidoreductase [Pseudomonadota bacterium]
MNNALGQSPLNAVVVGSGGIGTAVAARLLSEYPINQLFVLQRTARTFDDDRVTSLALDATEPASIAAATAAVCDHAIPLHLVFNAVGMLHGDGFRPEKRLKDVSAEAMMHLAAVNAFLLPQLAAGLAPALRHSEPSVLASVSARVGSIADNDMGGWYSYRASKAAHNMLLKTLSREWRVSHKHCAVVALHPGTVATELSKPYTPPNYNKRVLTPAESAEAMLNVVARLDVTHSGRFYAWDGAEIPW